MDSAVAGILRYEIGSTVIPGDRLGTTSAVRRVGSTAMSSSSFVSLSPGSGTYVRGGYVCASVAGRLEILVDDDSTNNKTVAVVRVVPTNKKSLASNQVIAVGQIVMGQVSRITMQQAMVRITAVQGIGGLLHNVHEGVIRSEDVRTGATEQVQMQESFRPNDFVIARVLSLGDARRYYLSTAEPELGVIHARSATSGKPMMPTSEWKVMICTETKTKEPRKCARPPPAVIGEN